MSVMYERIDSDGEVVDLTLKILKKYSERFGHIHYDDMVFLYKFADKSDWAGQCRLIKGVWEAITDKKVMISLWHENWVKKSTSEKALLLFHEICHIGYDDDKAKYTIIKHDVEDFREILREYGVDWEDSQKFLDNLK